MKGGLLVSLMMGCTLMTVASSSVLAQSGQNLQSLPNGDYFFGEASSPAEAGAGYVVFRKTGGKIAGLFYQQGEQNIKFCFAGTDKVSGNKDVSQEKPVSTTGETSLADSLGLEGLFKLRFDQLPDAAAKSFQECVK